MISRAETQRRRENMNRKRHGLMLCEFGFGILALSFVLLSLRLCVSARGMIL